MCEGWKEETELEEKLVGGQKKLDKNHNGKLDKQDFKMLRKEEVEQIDELSPATMMKYQYKSASRIDHAAQNARSMGSDKDHLKKPYGNEIRKRKKGLNLASERLAKKSMDEEVENVEEGNANLIKKIEKQKPKAVEKGFDYPSHDPKTADRKTLTSFHKEIKKFNKEEVQFSEAEIARIEEIAKGL